MATEEIWKCERCGREIDALTSDEASQWEVWTVPGPNAEPHFSVCGGCQTWEEQAKIAADGHDLGTES